MTPEENHRDFVEKARRLLDERPNSGIMLLVSSERGLEIMSSIGDAAFQFGVLRLADETITMRVRGLMKEEIRNGMNAANIDMISMEVSGKKGPVN